MLQLKISQVTTRAPRVALVVKGTTSQCRRRKRRGSIPGSGRSPGGGHGHPLHYSCLENPTDGGACSPRGQTQLRRLATHAHTHASGRKWGLTRARLGPALNSTQSSPKINADNCNKAGASLPEIPAFRSAWTRAPTGRTRLGGEVTPAPSSFHFPDSATQRKVRSA